MFLFSAYAAKSCSTFLGGIFLFSFLFALNCLNSIFPKPYVIEWVLSLNIKPFLLSHNFNKKHYHSFGSWKYAINEATAENEGRWNLRRSIVGALIFLHHQLFLNKWATIRISSELSSSIWIYVRKLGHDDMELLSLFLKVYNVANSWNDDRWCRYMAVIGGRVPNVTSVKKIVIINNKKKIIIIIKRWVIIVERVYHVDVVGSGEIRNAVLGAGRSP